MTTHTPTCGYCTNTATVALDARGNRSDVTLRSTLACPAHHQKARKWTARAGPPHEQPLTPNQETNTLF